MADLLSCGSAQSAVSAGLLFHAENIEYAEQTLTLLYCYLVFDVHVSTESPPPE